MATVSPRKKTGRPAKPVGYWGQNVLRFAEPLGLTYRQMAEVCGVSTSTFGHWMSGENTIPSAATERLADLFRVPMDMLRTTPPHRRRGSR